MAFVVCIAFLAAQIVVARTAPPPPLAHTSILDGDAAQMQSAANDPKPRAYYAGMSERRIFGGAGARGAGAAVKDAAQSLDELKPTALSLRLIGTTVGTEGMSTAVIEDTTSKTSDVYRVGDKVARTTTVDQILDRKVVLITDGKRELLVLAEAGGQTQPSAPRPSPRTTREPRMSRRPAGRNPAAATVVDRKEWEGKDVTDLLGDAKITPVYRNGRPDGLEVTNIAQNEYAKKVGLQEGDVVMSVNGVKIRSLDEAYDLANRLQKASTLRVEILRDGRPMPLTFNLQQ
jgi:general secretion pathway protein C